MISENDKKIIKNDNTFRGLVKELILFWLFYLIFAAIISLILFLIFGFEWFFIYYYFYIIYILFPLILVVFFLWVIYIKKRNIKDFLWIKPKIPEKGHRWIYTVLFLFIILAIVTNIFLLWFGYSYILPISQVGWLYFFPAVIYGPIIEEITYRSYMNYRFEEVYGDKGIEIALISQKRDIESAFNDNKLLKWKLTTADLATALVFTFAHIHYIFNSDPYSAYYMFTTFYISCFILALLLSQARKDWNSILPCIIIHGLYNLHLARFIVYDYEKIRTLSPFLWMIMDIYPIDFIFLGVLAIVVIFRLVKKFRLNRKIKSNQSLQKE